MPTYTFKNNDTNEEFESFMSIKEYDQYLIDNPHISRTWYSAPAISGDSVGLGFFRRFDLSMRADEDKRLNNSSILSFEKQK